MKLESMLTDQTKDLIDFLEQHIDPFHAWLAILIEKIKIITTYLVFELILKQSLLI